MPKPVQGPPALFHAKWVAKIALLVALLAAAGLVLAILGATSEEGASYASIVSSHSLTQEKLGPVMLVFGLLLVAVAAFFTWLIALYSSFRIAGPLYRFAQNLKTIIQDSFASPRAIRKTDMLQSEWHEFEAAQSRLREHYGDLRDALDHCRQCQASQAGGPVLAAAVARLQEVERRGQL